MAITRDQVPPQDQWDTVSFYASWEAWEIDFEAANKARQGVEHYRNRLSEGSTVVLECLRDYFAVKRTIEALVTYAHLRQDENLGDDRCKGFFQRATSLMHRFAEQTAWLLPELLALPEEQLSFYARHANLSEYRFFFQRLIHERAHTLSGREEELLSMASKALNAPSSAFGMMENADFQFPAVADSTGKEHELTLGSYQLHQRSPDRALRKEAFEKLHAQFDRYANTFCELLNGEIQSHVFQTRARRFHSCVEAALFPHNIDTAVYRNLIATVRAGVAPLHRYMALRRQVLGLDAVHSYDMTAPLVPAMEREISYERAVEIVLTAVQPLGEQYQKTLQAGLNEQRWVDRYENQGKRSGGYSSGCYDSHPYILLNYSSSMRDALVLAHEAGHSMHSFLSHRSQPFHDAHYPIFLAEVASTFNEELLFRLLLQQAATSAERLSLVSQRIDDIRGTLYRQTLFAEFELWLHELAEKGEPLTPSGLKERYRALNVDYYGPHLAVDELLTIEWARIPHFYYNFYVYQYATGISAALYLVDRVTSGGEEEKQAYLRLLSAGGSAYPLDLLEQAGVDMRSPAPVSAAIAHFDQLVCGVEKELPSGSGSARMR
jgi:oligoendopeptidase F